jgi:hypothetical protein
MQVTFQQIKCIAEDIRLNPNMTKEVAEFQLRVIEDLCTQSIMLINEIRNENN